MFSIYFGDGVLSSVVTYIANGVAGAGIEEVSDKFGHDTFSVEKLVAKATINCLAASARDASCGAAAVGTFVTDFLVETNATLGLDPSQYTEEELVAAYKDRLEFAAAVAGFLTSGGEAENVSTAANAALLDFENNLCGTGACVAIIAGIVGLLTAADYALTAYDAYQVAETGLACDAGDQAACDQVVELAKQFGIETSVEMTLGQVVPGSKIGMKIVAAIKKRGDPELIKAVDEAVGDATNNADDVVFRGDTRGPDEIFDEGFQPRNPGSDTSLEDYVDYNAPSDYVGTTTNRPTGDSSIEGSPEAFGTGHGDQDGFVYEIDRPSNGIDVNSQYPDGPFPNENEIAVPGGIDPSCIRGCTPVGPDGSVTGDFIPNPNYTGDN